MDEEEYWLKELEKLDLLDVFKVICNYTVEISPNNPNLFICNPVNREELFSEIRKIRNKSDSILQGYINQLIDIKLCCYTNNLRNDSPQIGSTGNQNIGIKVSCVINNEYSSKHGYNYSCGASIYRHIVNKEENYKRAFKIANEIEDFVAPYQDEVTKLRLEFDKKIEQIEKMTNDNIIKNIQVISIFAGIIALIFTNIMGIKEYAIIGYVGIMLINSSLFIAIISMLLTVKLIIQKEKIDKATIGTSIILILLTFVPIVVNRFISK